jgi:predicted transcriptional regulator
MKKQTIIMFTEEEEEFVNLLVEIGTQKNVAKMLVFLANVQKASSRDIERGTDMRQPDVSLAIKYLSERHWVESQNIHTEKKGRPMKLYSLIVSIGEIMNIIEQEKQIEVDNQLNLVQKLKISLNEISP